MIILNEDSRKPIVIQDQEDYGPAGIDIRQHYYSAEDEMLPTKKGVRIPDEDKHEFLAAMLIHILGWTEGDIESVKLALVQADWNRLANEFDPVATAASMVELG